THCVTSTNLDERATWPTGYRQRNPRATPTRTDTAKNAATVRLGNGCGLRRLRRILFANSAATRLQPTAVISRAPPPTLTRSTFALCVRRATAARATITTALLVGRLIVRYRPRVTARCHSVTARCH